MTCANCRHCIGTHDRGLWCIALAKPAREKCWMFEYAPGTQ